MLQVPIHHFAEHCQRRLEKTMQSGAKRGIRKPSQDEIEQAKVMGSLGFDSVGGVSGADPGFLERGFIYIYI